MVDILFAFSCTIYHKHVFYQLLQNLVELASNTLWSNVGANGGATEWTNSN